MPSSERHADLIAAITTALAFTVCVLIAFVAAIWFTAALWRVFA